MNINSSLYQEKQTNEQSIESNLYSALNAIASLIGGNQNDVQACKASFNRWHPNANGFSLVGHNSKTQKRNKTARHNDEQ